jgi:hypothetical protein
VNDIDPKTQSALVELFSTAARQYGMTGDIEITINRGSQHEKVSNRRNRRKPRLPRRKSTSVLG